MWWVKAVLVVCVTSSAATAAGEGYRLPTDLWPSHYDLRLLYDVDPDTAFNFFGVVHISLTAVKSTTKIVLHAENLTLSNNRVRVWEEKLEGRGEVRVIEVTPSGDDYNLVTVQLDASLEPGRNYTLTMPFSGQLISGLNGVYVSSYLNKNTSSKQYLVTTQFEATAARKGFPCFDEPMYKATFSINIGHHRDYIAVSNMPLAASSGDSVLEDYWPWSEVEQKFKKNKSSFVWDQFQRSVPMSTYLVAFTVSDFGYIESPPELSKTKFRIWARKDALNQAEYASLVGPKVLSYFEQWFNVSFPLPKQDMFAIPDFAAGAMENWGLITYRETALLYDQQHSSFLNKERVAEVIAHELAHQWFGNLVTMKWWSDLWLNEGFATFMAAVGVDAVEPSWEARQTSAVEDTLSLLELDSLESSHPVSVTIDDPKSISEIFDHISYRKGSALVRMMTLLLGEDIFRKGINQYLVKYSYKNAEQDDLWGSLTAASLEEGVSLFPPNVTLKQVMDTWTTQTGYPLLTVTRNYDGSTAAISQKRYLSGGVDDKSSASWWVPLGVRREGEEDEEHRRARPLQWLGAHQGTHAEHQFQHETAHDHWLLLNNNYLAPYRVNYDKRNWQLLTRALLSQHTSVPLLSRVQLVSDAFALAWSGTLDYTTTLQLASYLQRETEYLPLYTGLDELSKIELVLKRSPDYGAYQKFVRRLITNTYQKVGGLAAKKILNGNDLTSVKMQVTVSSWACRMKVPGCEENAIEMFQEWMQVEDPDNHNPIPLDLRKTVYCVAIRRGSVAHWRFLLSRKQRSNVASAKSVFEQALTCTHEVWILAQYLEWSITEGSEVRQQDAPSVMAAVARSTVGYYVAKDFIYTRIKDIQKALNGEGSRIGRIVKALVEQFTTQKELDEFVAWRDNNKEILAESKLTIEQAVEYAKVNVDWLAKNRQQVVDKMREFST